MIKQLPHSHTKHHTADCPPDPTARSTQHSPTTGELQASPICPQTLPPFETCPAALSHMKIKMQNLKNSGRLSTPWLPALSNIPMLLKCPSAMPKCMQAPCRHENKTTFLLCYSLPLFVPVLAADGVYSGLWLPVLFYKLWIPTCVLCGTWAPKKLLPG